MGDLTPVAFLHSDFLQCAQANGRTLRRATSVDSLDADKTPAKDARKVVVRDDPATKRYVESTMSESMAALHAEIGTMKDDLAALRQEFDSRLMGQRQEFDSRLMEQRQEFDSRLQDLEVWLCVQVVSLTDGFVNAVAWNVLRKTGPEAWASVVSMCKKRSDVRKQVLGFIKKSYNLTPRHWDALIANRSKRNAQVHPRARVRLDDFVLGLRTVSTQCEEGTRLPLIDVLCALAAKKGVTREALMKRYREQYPEELVKRGTKRKASEEEPTGGGGAGPSRGRPARAKAKRERRGQ